MKEKTPSLGDIAKITGFSRMTVSYALRNNPRLSVETRKIIHAAAAKIGYIPDARLGAWMKKLRDTQRPDPITIAWLSNDEDSAAWQNCKWLSPFLEGTRRRCTELGYKLEEFWLQESGMSNRRISSILKNRGIQGVIIAPSQNVSVGRFKLNWEHLACVSFEKAIVSPHLHRVAPDYFHNIYLALKKLRGLGYRRIGVFLQQHSERRSNHNYLAAINYFHSTITEPERIPPLIYRHVEDAPGHSNKFERWLLQNNPDVVLGHHRELITWLSAVGLSVPNDIGVAHLAIEDDVADWSGVWQRKREIGAETAELLISMLQNNRFGLPKVAHDILIPGRWSTGWTLKPPPSRSQNGQRRCCM